MLPPPVILMRAHTPTENDLIVATLCTQSHDLTRPNFLYVVWEEKSFVVDSAPQKNVLLNALCLLTSLSCQFFCSAFVVAKDLCASSFASDPRCQRCPFDVECRPHTRHHLCSSACVCVRVCYGALAWTCANSCTHFLEVLCLFCVCARTQRWACAISHLQFLFLREQNGRWNNSVPLLSPNPMTLVIATVWFLSVL